MKVYTQASMDILHKGHINLLKKCRKLAGDGEVVVSLISDEAYEKYRGYKPALNFDNRYAVVSSFRYVDKVFRGDPGNTQNELLREKPDFIVLGTDWVAKDPYAHYGVTPEWLEGYGITLLFFPYTQDVSSTDIKNRINNGH